MVGSVEISIAIVPTTPKEPPKTIIATHNALILISTILALILSAEEPFSFVYVIVFTFSEMVIGTVQMTIRTALDTLGSLQFFLHPPAFLGLHRNGFSVHTETIHGIGAYDHNLAIINFVTFLSALKAGQLVVFVRTLTH